MLGRRFFDLPISQLLRKDHREPPFEGAYRNLKFVPYVGNFEWKDIRDKDKLEEAKKLVATRKGAGI